MDFLLKDHEIAVEVKICRENHRGRMIFDELLIDVGHYKHHPSCKTLVFFIYDPDGYLSNPGGLKQDLDSYSTEELAINTVIGRRA